MSFEASILFVDDNPNVLDGLKRMLRAMRRQWRMEFVESGAHALALLEERVFDVVVSDMKMPIMNGAQLFERIKEKYPQIIRIILSGYSDKEMILDTVGVAHQFLSKPCDQQFLIQTLVRAVRMRSVLKNPKLQELLSGIRKLPSMPNTAMEIVKELKKREPSIDHIVALVEQDPAISAKILQLVNSGFFGIPQKVSDIGFAVTFLGLETLQSIFLMVSVFSQMNAPAFFSVEGLLDHSLRVARLAQLIMKDLREPREIIQEAFTAGLLHDLGKLILVNNVPELWKKAGELSQEKGISFLEAEYEVLGASHAEVGGFLLGIWGLPCEIVEAVTFHDRPNELQAEKVSSLLAVAVANFIVRSDRSKPDSAELDGIMQFLGSLDMAHKYEEWKDLWLNLEQNNE